MQGPWTEVLGRNFQRNLVALRTPRVMYGESQKQIVQTPESEVCWAVISIT